MAEPFQSWSNYWGLLYADADERCPSRVYGFENFTSGMVGSVDVPDDGACFGFISAGAVMLLGDSNRDSMHVRAGQWFSTDQGCHLVLDTTATTVFVAQRVGYRGVFSVGGPIEERGRLRYIDGCSDSLLVCPPVIGHPCLNHLHFPGGIDQTEHTHPSLRAGIVARGEGWCETPEGATRLTQHLIFAIPTDAKHSFRTEAGRSMDVVPYHPDSDWGPTNEEHPMVNRTLVAGEKIDNTQARHATAELTKSFVFIP